MKSYIKYKINKFARKQKITNWLDRIILKNKKIAIVSNNCWNIGIYKNLNMQFNTPFIGLAINTNDFIKILSNLEYFLHFELTDKNFIDSSNYPIAILNGITIHFMHYTDSKSAISKWNRRKDRLLNYINNNGIDNVIFKCCDKDSIDSSDFEKFNKLPLKRKIYYRNTKKSIFLNRDGVFPDGIQLYDIRLLRYFEYLRLFKGL
ncbi:DUF1919 domain-containing protein [Proteus sp. G2661]|nr:DUF1919 domain-containing protein [Proteus sp. G2661]